jgi:hypothetical protein
MRDALEPLAALGFAASRELMRGLGLRPAAGYVWGRAAALGEPAPSVVVAAFGVFSPGLVVDAYREGRAAASQSDVLAAREEGAQRCLDPILGQDPDIYWLAATLLEALDRATGAGRPLFSGLREVARPKSACGLL